MTLIIAFMIIIALTTLALAWLNPSPCARCGGKLKRRTTVERREKGSAVQFFQCKDCGFNDDAP